ncbi:MAG: AAA family ATPase [Candidatus Bilamarchaeaceae archaeon]
MLFISRLKLRGFKSFKFADIQIPRDFLALAGPNGSGKSNVCDAIRFVLGESSFKSLRARKVKDLIHAGGRTAEVTIYFEGDERLEIKRAIREDGKMLYKMNGSKTTRSAIQDALRKHNLDSSGRNIIPQGEVKRIVEVGGKERRTIIDDVAGVSDFEQKKKETLSELDVVETRIKDASIVMGERGAILKELEKEKEDAIRYRQSTEDLKSAKASLLRLEISNGEKAMADLKANEDKILFNMNSKKEDISRIESGIASRDSERMALSKSLQERKQTRELSARIEDLKSAISSDGKLLNDREGTLKKMDEDIARLQKEIPVRRKEIDALVSESSSISSEINKLASILKDDGGQAENAPVSALKKELDTLSSEIKDKGDAVHVLEKELASKTEILRLRKEQAENLGGELKGAGADVAKSETESLQKAVSAVNREIDEMFKREKEINGEIADIDRRLITLQEQASQLRVVAAPSLSNPAFRFISELKEKGEIRGIHGMLADLVSFDVKYAPAVEAAGGARLTYIVVDDADTASEIIRRLKRAGSGRATFIPLAEISPGKPVSSGDFSSVLEVIEYDARYAKAAEFVFGDSLLVDSMDSAKKVGIGRFRMVTQDGEIFERSGVISGGKVQTSILATAQLNKIIDQINDVKSTRTSLNSELLSLRESSSKKRFERSDLELKIKTIEIETRNASDKLRELDAKRRSLESLAKEISALEASISSAESKRGRLDSELKASEQKLQALRLRIEEGEASFSKAKDEKNKARTEQVSHLSSLRATLDGKARELELQKGDLLKEERELKDSESERKRLAAEMTSLRRAITENQGELSKLEEKLSEHSKEIEKVYKKMSELEDSIRLSSEEKATLVIAVDRLNRDLTNQQIRKAEVETRLRDFKEEFEKHKGAPEMEGTKDSLSERIKECEALLNSIINVNLASIEQYDKKKAEIDGMKSKIDLLRGERKAIMEMLSEIEQKKKDAFFEAFYAISDNFKNIFKYIHIGEGYLYLDNPNSPFESGLHIKLKRDGKEYSIDSLSGGESTLLALMFIFAMQFYKPSPFYTLDEADSALDKENSKNLANLIKQMAKDTQFFVITHNDTLMSMAHAVFGVTKIGGVSKIVGVKLEDSADAPKAGTSGSAAPHPRPAAQAGKKPASGGKDGEEDEEREEKYEEESDMSEAED